MSGNKQDGVVLVVVGCACLIGSALLWLLAWSEDWTALPIVGAVAVTACGLVVGGFGLAKLV